jgi:hypothetical protein
MTMMSPRRAGVAERRDVPVVAFLGVVLGAAFWALTAVVMLFGALAFGVAFFVGFLSVLVLLAVVLFAGTVAS